MNDSASIPLAPSPVTCKAVRQLFGDSGRLEALLEVVKGDPRLSEKLVDLLAGSPSSGPAEGSEHSAPDSDTVRSMAAALDMGTRILASDPGRTFDTGALWLHAAATGAVLAEAGKVLEWPRPERFFILGLLHDLGVLYLDRRKGPGYAAVKTRIREGISLEAAEREVFGEDHMEVAARQLDAWAEVALPHQFRVSLPRPPHCLDPSRLAAEAAALAEWIGYVLPLPGDGGPPRASNLLSVLSPAQAHGVGRAAQDRTDAIGRALGLPLPDRACLQDVLVMRSYDLSLSNDRYARSQAELESRVAMLEPLTRVLTSINHTLHRDAFYFSVLEAVLEGFRMKGAFLLEGTARSGLSGFAARCGVDGDPEVNQVRIPGKDVSPYLRKCLTGKSPVCIRHPGAERVLRECMGEVSIAWLAPIPGRSRFITLLGLGAGCRDHALVQNEDFSKILEILCGEIALSIENTRLFRRLRRQANTDTLTSMSNRRTILKILVAEFARYKRKGGALSVALFDIDRFKEFNDRYGHVPGDRFLAQAAARLRKGIRASDFIGRYGGDEFLAVFPETPAEEAYLITQRVYRKLAEASFKVPGMDRMEPFETSAGVAGAEPWMTRAEELVQRADEALYEAKKEGRNRCRLRETLSSSR